jgi:hypothetical protein
VTSLTVGIAAVPSALAGTPAAPPVTLSGNLAGAGGSYTATSLAAVAQVTQKDTFLAGSASSTYSFTGVPVSTLLGSAGLDTSSVLDDYVVATGSDGYGVVYSGGELDPSIRGSTTALVAYDDGTGTFPSIGGTSGALRTTAPGDSKGGRYVSNLDSLAVKTPNNDAVTRLYLDALGRLPDAGGGAYWSGLLDNNVSLSQIASGILQSSEFLADVGAGLSNAGFVARLYQDGLGRTGEAGGVAYWTGQLDSGTSLADVLVGFSNTPEAILHAAGAAGLAA